MNGGFTESELEEAALEWLDGVGYAVAHGAEVGADYTRLRPQLSGLERFDLDREPLNNAVLVNYRIYFHQLEAFAALNHGHDGDLETTIKTIIALAQANPDHPFEAISRAASPSPIPSPTAAVP